MVGWITLGCLLDDADVDDAAVLLEGLHEFGLGDLEGEVGDVDLLVVEDGVGRAHLDLAELEVLGVHVGVLLDVVGLEGDFEVVEGFVVGHLDF